MKTTLTLFAAIVAIGVSLAPAASAYDSCQSGYYITRVVGYDHCGHPIYRKVWVEVCQPAPRFVLPLPGPPPFFGGHGHGSSHGGGHHHHH